MSTELRSRYTTVRRRLIPVEVYGETHFLRSITDSERSQWESELFDAKGKVDPKMYRSQRIRLLALCLCDEQIQPLFEYKEWPSLKNMDGGLSAILYDNANQKCLYVEGEPTGSDNAEKKSEPTESDSLSESA
jgi:hypothetical protein